VGRFQYACDANSNRTQRDLSLTGGLDELYTYDDLNRLTSMQRGTLSGGAIGSETRQEDWGLDALGNWETYDVEVNNAAFLEQERDHNDVNEVGVIDIKPEGTGTDWADVVHDDRGNMTTIPKPTSLSASLTCVYDAWNRLVAVVGFPDSIWFSLDGAGRRGRSAEDTFLLGRPGTAVARPDGRRPHGPGRGVFRGRPRRYTGGRPEPRHGRRLLMQTEAPYTEAINLKYPEPVVVAIAKDAQGKYNPISLGWCMCTSFKPPMLAISIGLTRYSLEAVRSAGAFVVAMPSEDQEADVMLFGTKSGRDMDKLGAAGTKTVPAERIDCVLLDDAVANFECRVAGELRTGDHVIFAGEVVRSTMNPEKPNRLYTVGAGHIMGGLPRKWKR